MTGIFLKLVNMSISVSWLVLAVLALRLLLKKSPKWINVMLWGIVAIRLLCPFSIESALSLIPSTETLPSEILSGPSFDVNTGIAPVDERVNDYLGDRYFEGVSVPANNGANTMGLLTAIWVIGVAVMFVYAAVSYWRLRRRVDTAVLLRKNLFQSEAVVSPFVLGLFRPRIYLPFGLDGAALAYVLAHETAHIRRRDHWWKPLGFLLLTIHWFNPLMWLAYALLCRDIELACDETVIKELGHEQRADYTQVLVACSVSRRVIAACPLAFGEAGVKERVRSVLHYKKPTFWIIAVSVIVCAVVAVCFLTDPEETAVDPFGQEYMVGEAIFARHMFQNSWQAKFSISSDQVLYRLDMGGQEWHCVGAFSEMPLTKSRFDRYLDGGTESAAWEKEFSAKKIRRENEKAWKCVDTNGTSYYLLSQENGEIYLVGLFYDMEGEYDSYSDDSNIFYILRLKAAPGLTCIAYSGDTEAYLKPGFYPDGFTYHTDELVCGEIDTQGQLVFQPEWETDSLVVTETYGKWDGTGYPASETQTYTLEARADGSFALDVARRGELAGEAYYLVQSESGVYVFKLVFSGLQQGSKKPEVDTTPILALEDAISDVVTRNYTDIRGRTAGYFFVTSNQVLAYTINGAAENSYALTLYLLVLRQEREFHDCLDIEVDELVPVVITFAVDEDGSYILQEYWEPQEGEDRAAAVRSRFPAEAAEIALSAKLYEQEELRRACHQQAMILTTPGVMFRDVWVDEAVIALKIELCLRIIASSPAYSSSPYDYIDAHPAEVAELVGYSDYMLRYCFGKFLQGGEDGLYGYLMAIICHEIAQQRGEMLLTAESSPITGQQWFEAVKNNALRLAGQCTDEELELLYPVSLLLLQMMEGG